MAEHVHHQSQQAEVDHEKSDVNVRAILSFAGGLIALAVVVYLVVWLLFGYLSRREDRASGARTYPLAVGQEDRLPPEPRLQTNPRQDLRDLRTAEDQTLKSYQWIDQNGGVVRIPIDEAIKLTLQRGLPARQAPQQEVVK